MIGNCFESIHFVFRKLRVLLGFYVLYNSAPPLLIFIYVFTNAKQMFLPTEIISVSISLALVTL